MKDFIDYVVKNKYVIICIAIVLVLYALGIVEFLTRLVILAVLLGGAIFIGKKLQDNESYFKDLFESFKTKRNVKNDDNVYYYQEKDDKK